MENERFMLVSSRIFPGLHMVTLQKQGLRSDAIAPLVGVSARTVHRWLADGIEKGVRQKRPSPLDAFAQYIYQRIRAGGPTGKQLYEELQSLGYQALSPPFISI
jgi:transposase